MNSRLKQYLFWTPRVLGILFVLFISLFAFDVFDESLGFWDSALAFLIHLIPAIVVMGVLAIAWKWERIGAILFIALAIFYVIWAWGRLHWSAYALIPAPLVLISILFFLDWINRAKLRT